MADVRMPDGTIVRNVPEGTTRSQLQARFDKMNAPTGYNESSVSQGLSGVNEGVAQTMDLAASLSPVGLLTKAARGINTLTGSKAQIPNVPFTGGGDFGTIGRQFGAIGPESKAPGNKFVRRVGQSVGAAAIPVAGTAGSLANAGRAMIPAVTGGIGAAVAKDIAPNNPVAEFLAELAGGAAGGGIAYSAAKRAANRKAATSVPTIPELKKQAAGLYDLAERNGVKASQQQTTKLYDTISDIAKQEGLISPTGRVSEAYPKAKEALRLAEDYAQGEMTPKQMQTVRKVLSEAAGGTDPSEQRIARKMLAEFDNWTAPLSPELGKARGIARRYINAQKLETAREQAGATAGQFSGSGFENALRTQYRGLDKKIIKGQDKGFTPDTVAAIRDVSRGTKASNAARFVGKAAPTGVVSTSAGMGVPFAIGNAIGGPVAGGAMAVTVPTVGAFSRHLATKMGMRSADLAELIARNGGKLPPAMVFTPEVRKLVAAMAAGQASPYLNKKQVKKKGP